MNVVFISPHFPLYFHNFCSRLKERGVNVLGIGDEDYNLISNEAKNAVTEYYKVSNFFKILKKLRMHVSSMKINMEKLIG